FNLVGRVGVEQLSLPVHLDMWGTAIAAIALGPWRGALVGATTNIAGMAISGADSAPFLLVNVAGALVWGYGIAKFEMGRTLPRFFTLNLLVAAVCSVVAVPIVVFVFGGSVGHDQDDMTRTFLAMTHELVVAVGLSNVVTSVGDKVISGFVALVVILALPVGLRNRDKLTLAGSAGPTHR
ncbi:MAG: hypothetical protein WB508_11205, partial [Aeromicrobium sp.]|uniref:hypothetical protein n=1 Tax=Aeromicrobium sp. TaxID=1871063 RepID=UPI003C4AC7C3